MSSPTPIADFVFFAHELEELGEKHRHVLLTEKDLRLMNPNSRTCPLFKSKREADIVRRMYRSVPVLLDKNRKKGGNPWEMRLTTMFHQTNDAEHFRDQDTLMTAGYKLTGNHWLKGKEEFLPLVEAKMVRDYDHRYASVYVNANNWMNQGQGEESSLVDHQNPEFLAQPRYWVAGREVAERMGMAPRWGFVGFRDITRATDTRTMLAMAVPWSGLINHIPVFLTPQTAKREMCLLGNLNAIAYDFVVRQKFGGMTLNFFIVEQIPTLPPDAYDGKCPWAKSKKLEDWVADRVLKLTCTADDMRPLAEAAGFEPGVWKWKDEERAVLRAELDAAYFHLYKLSRDDVEYILGTFQGIAKEDEKADGQGATRRLIMEAYDGISG
jgi:hypothetical protein